MSSSSSSLVSNVSFHVNAFCYTGSTYFHGYVPMGLLDIFSLHLGVSNVKLSSFLWLFHYPPILLFVLQDISHSFVILTHFTEDFHYFSFKFIMLSVFMFKFMNILLLRPGVFLPALRSMKYHTNKHTFFHFLWTFLGNEA